MFTDTTLALRATALLLNGMADRLDAQFMLHAAHRVAVGFQTPHGFRRCQPDAAWTVTPPCNGRATIDLGENYELLLNEHSSQIQVRNKHNGEVTNIWGDPHIDWNQDGKTDADFWTKTTFMLEDGTKITIDTEPWKGNQNMYVASEVTITKGDRAIQVTGLSQNEIGDLQIEQSETGGRLLDWAVKDGFLVKENACGEGWINPSTGKLATQKDFDVTKPGAPKPYEFTQAFGQMLGAWLLTGVATSLLELSWTTESSKPCEERRPFEHLVRA